MSGSRRYPRFVTSISSFRSLHMKHQRIAEDLAEARLKSGLRQVDCAHLLEVSESYVSAIESGRLAPNITTVATLSIVYGKQIESLLSGLLDEVVDRLIRRLGTIPPVSEDTRGTFNRAHTLSQLAIRLESLTSATHDGQ